MRVRLAALAALSLLLEGARAAAADPTCGTSSRPVVELVLEVEPPDRIIGTTLQQHLRAELGAREIDVCVAPVTPRQPIARVSLHVDHPARGPVVATIRVGDLVTDKRLERALDLTRLPDDSRPLAVAAAVDELLRASWVELTLSDAPRPSVAPPAAVVHAVASSARPSPAAPSPSPSIIEVGVVAAASDLVGHRTAFGGEAWIGGWFHPSWALLVRFKAEAGLARASLHGTARADDIAAGARLAFSPVDHDGRFGLRFEAGADVLRVTLAGASSGAAVAADGVQWTGMADATLRGWARTGPLFWTVSAGAAAALHPARATDNGVPVTAIEGLGPAFTAGLIYHVR
jgi:hypothetical protein